MDQDSPVIYGLEFQARALACYCAETDLVQYFAGTQSLRCQNQVHLITFEDETNSISKKIFTHSAGEIWSLSSPMSQRNLLSSVYNEVSGNKTTMRAAVWRFTTDDETSALIDDGTSSAPLLQEVTKVQSSELGDVRSLLWYPSTERSEFVLLVEGHLLHCDLEASGSEAKVISKTSLEGKLQPKFTSGCWDPHHNCTQVATAQDTSVKGWDLRSMQPAYTIENAHSHLVRGLDFNPNKQYFMATCGDDCKVKFWDIRKASSPVKILSDHSHWIWNVKYNHFHDQLVITSSSDGRVILNNLPSISSEPYGNLIADEEDDEKDEEEDLESKSRSEATADGIVLKYDEHEDSVYGVEWSSADPWVFASLSYDGRMVVGRVPRRIKYQILL